MDIAKSLDQLFAQRIGGASAQALPTHVWRFMWGSKENRSRRHAQVTPIKRLLISYATEPL